MATSASCQTRWKGSRQGELQDEQAGEQSMLTRVTHLARRGCLNRSYTDLFVQTSLTDSTLNRDSQAGVKTLPKTL